MPSLSVAIIPSAMLSVMADRKRRECSISCSAAFWSVMSWQVPTMRTGFPSLPPNASVLLADEADLSVGPDDAVLHFGGAAARASSMACSTLTASSGARAPRKASMGAVPLRGGDAVDREHLVRQELEPPAWRGPIPSARHARGAPPLARAPRCGPGVRHRGVVRCHRPGRPPGRATRRLRPGRKRLARRRRS